MGQAEGGKQVTTRSTYPKCATCKFYDPTPRPHPECMGPTPVSGTRPDFGCILHSSLDAAQSEAPAPSAACVCGHRLDCHVTGGGGLACNKCKTCKGFAYYTATRDPNSAHKWTDAPDGFWRRAEPERDEVAEAQPQESDGSVDEGPFFPDSAFDDRDDEIQTKADLIAALREENESLAKLAESRLAELHNYWLAAPAKPEAPVPDAEFHDPAVDGPVEMRPLDALQTECSRLRGMVHAKQVALDSLHQQLSKVEHEREDIRKLNFTLRTEGAAGVIREQQHLMFTYQERIGELEGKLNSTLDANSLLLDTKSDLREDREKLIKANREYAERVRLLESDVLHWKDESKGWAQSASDAAVQLDEAHSKIRGLEHATEDMKVVLDKLDPPSTPDGSARVPRALRSDPKPNPIAIKVEPGSTLVVGATYRVTGISRRDNSPGHDLGDVVLAVEEGPHPGRPYVYTGSRQWGDEPYWLACYGANGSTWVTGLELVSPAAEPETVGEA